MRYGIDLGGTKTEIVALAPSGGEVFRLRNATPRGNYKEIVANIEKLVKHADKETGTSGSIGVGIPGAISPHSGLVKNANTTELIGHPLQGDLEQLLNRPVRIANDANCFALSEASDGAGAGHHTVFGIIIGTGVGGGIVIKGTPLLGAHSIAGEWGHNPLPWPDNTEQPGPKCYCGKYGCIETFLSGPALEQDHFSHTDFKIPPHQIVEAVSNGDTDAEKTLERYERRLAKALASVVNVIDPDIIVCGGGLSNLSRLYENVPKLMPQFVFSDKIETPIVPAEYGDSSGVRGAAWLWPME
ncbi:ROK family protein [Sneathiella sp. P13V-1]|nr:ROK family protein [Sneathiella sp. P13V-1]